MAVKNGEGDIVTVALRGARARGNSNIGFRTFLAKQTSWSLQYSVKQSVKDETTWHVFIQEFAAALNRKKLLQYKRAAVARIGVQMHSCALREISFLFIPLYFSILRIIQAHKTSAQVLSARANVTVQK